MKKILVCDDDATISEVVAIILLDGKLAQVYTLADTRNLLPSLARIKPALIFMDHHIPVNGGIEATRSIKAHPQYKHIPVVYFTGNPDIDTLAREAGAEYILAKPFNIKDLEALVHEALK